MRVYESGHVLLPATNGHLFICPKHGQMEGIMPWSTYQIINREHKCGLCKNAIGRKVDDARGLRIARQIIGDSIKTYA